MLNFKHPEYVSHDGLYLATYRFVSPHGPANPLAAQIKTQRSTIFLLHGWPEIAYSWSHLIGPLTQAGFDVIAQDLRGFGHSSAPKAMHHYHITQMVGDVEACLDHYGLKDVILCGHDWGGIILWHAARMIKERISHLIGLATPHVAPPPVSPIDIFRRRHGDEHYFVHFHDHPGVAERIFSENIKAFFELMFRTTPKGATFNYALTHIPKRVRAHLNAGAICPRGQILSADQIDVYARAFTRSGFHGGLHLYRNSMANWEFAQGLSQNITQPTLMISARQDLFLPPETTDTMPIMVSDLERHILEDCGHWMMWEQPERLSRIMLDWLAARI